MLPIYWLMFASFLVLFFSVFRAIFLLEALRKESGERYANIRNTLDALLVERMERER